MKTKMNAMQPPFWAKLLAKSPRTQEGRLTFARKDGSIDQPANAPSCLVSYSIADSDAIRLASARGDIKGRLVELDIAF